LLIGGPLVDRVDRLTNSATRTMDAATAAADAAADALDGFDASLQEARDSATEAAVLSRETAGTVDALAAAMSLSVLGSQPLLPLADEFNATASRMRELGDNLEEVGSALATNRDDLAAVSGEMRELAGSMEELGGRIGEERTSGDIPLTWLYYGFLVWQVLPIMAAAIGSAWLFRHMGVTSPSAGSGAA
ncbi:MAG TPA: hypothetical protein VHH53_03880, partial [Pseudonocardiaceae bacterium]|nr:hypothetical protein [Pseudonocardiaceae bacterium]